MSYMDFSKSCKSKHDSHLITAVLYHMPKDEYFLHEIMNLNICIYMYNLEFDSAQLDRCSRTTWCKSNPRKQYILFLVTLFCFSKEKQQIR